MKNVVDIITRNTAVKTNRVSEGNLLVSLTEPSVVIVHADAKSVVSYERVGNDLLIHMKDGSVIRCNSYFIADSNNELVFQDESNQLTQITFNDVVDGTVTADSAALTHSDTSIASVTPFISNTASNAASQSAASETPWGLIAAGALGVGAVGAAIGHNSGNDSNNAGGNTPAVAKIAFVVVDDTGDKKGVLANQAITDETRPTFQGVGQPGARIDIIDVNGNVIASTTIAANGSWSVQVPPQNVGEHTFNVVQSENGEVTDSGNISLTVVEANAALIFDIVTDDNIISADEKNSDLVISGLSRNLASGSALTVTLNGKTYLTTVGADGAWRVTVPVADVGALAQGDYVIKVSGTDAAGNHISRDQTITLEPDTFETLTLKIDNITNDNVINKDELANGLWISGSTNAGKGAIVTVILNGTDYTALVDENGRWKLFLDPKDFSDGENTLTATVSNAEGQKVTAQSKLEVDTTADVTLSIDDVTADDIINAEEMQQPLTITGKSTGAAAGDRVTVVIDTIEKQAIVDADGNWSVQLSTDDLSKLPEGALTIQATLSDKEGNISKAEHDITVDTIAPEIIINAITGDDILDAVEQGKGLEVSGYSNAFGQEISLEIKMLDADGRSMTKGLFNFKIGNNGSWKFNFPLDEIKNLVDGVKKVVAIVKDVAGNVMEVARIFNVSIESADAKITVDPLDLPVENTINAQTVKSDLTIYGTSANFNTTKTLTVTLGKETYPVTVGSDGSWKVTIPKDVLAALPTGQIKFSVKGTDDLGKEVQIDKEITVDTVLPTLNINSPFVDNVLNAAESQTTQYIRGTAKDVEPGQTVTVTINGKSFTTEVGTNGSWKIALSPGFLSTLPQGPLDITATIADKAGNITEQTHQVTVDSIPPKLTLDPIAGDDKINASEATAGQEISGTGEKGQTVQITIGTFKSTTVVDENGNWSYTIPAAELAKLPQDDLQVIVSITDKSGNVTTVKDDLLLDTLAPTLTMDPVTGDDVISFDEAHGMFVLTGQSNEIGGKVDVEFVGQGLYGMEKRWSFSSLISKAGKFATKIPWDDVKAVAGDVLTIVAKIKDNAGNVSEVVKNVKVQTAAGKTTLSLMDEDGTVSTYTLASGASVASASLTSDANVSEPAAYSNTPSSHTVVDNPLLARASNVAASDNPIKVTETVAGHTIAVVNTEKQIINLHNSAEHSVQTTLLYKLINATDTTGGHGHNTVNGFTLGATERSTDADRIDLRELLQDSGVTAKVSNGVPAGDINESNISDYIKVVVEGNNTDIQIDRDGSGTDYYPTTLLTLNGVQTDLATLLANQQLLVV